MNDTRLLSTLRCSRRWLPKRSEIIDRKNNDKSRFNREAGS